MNQFRFVQAVDGFGERIVVAIAATIISQQKTKPQGCFMRRTLGRLPFVFLCLINAGAFAAPITPGDPTIMLPGSSAARTPVVVPNELLVRFAQPLATQSLPTGEISAFASQIKPLGNSGYVRMTLSPQAGSLNAAMSNIRALPGVLAVQPNYRYFATALTNDPAIGQQWGLQNTAQLITTPSYSTNNPGVAGDDIDVADAWQHQTDCRSVTVAVIDTGINYTQQDLAANMWNGGSAYPHHGYDFVDNDNDPYPAAGGEQHGSHVAGIIGAVGNNGIEGSGVCQQASIMALRALDQTGGSTSTLISAIDFAVDHGAKVINMSLGGTGGNDPALSKAVQYAQQKGVVLVVAAGNDGTDNDQTPFYPCNDSTQFSNLICVAALDQSFQLASFSNYGAQSVTLGAPGTNIISTIAGPGLSTNFSQWTGSSSTSTGWGYGSTTSGIAVLADPKNYGSAQYAINTDDRAWGSFTTPPGTQFAALNYYLQGNLSAGDTLNTAVIGGSNTDPFGSGGSTLATATGSLSSPASPVSVNQCVSGPCSIGFQLKSGSTGGNTGALIAYCSLETVAPNTIAMASFDGTSMATPMVSGVVALAMAANPNAPASRIIQAVEQSGTPVPALTGKTSTGRAVNAMNTLANLHLNIGGLTNLSASAGQTITMNFSVSGYGGLTLLASSSNPAVLPNSAITGTSQCTAEGNCSLQLTPSNGGSSVVSLQLQDGYGQQTTAQFSVTVSGGSGGSGGGGSMNLAWLAWISLMLAAVRWRSLRR